MRLTPALADHRCALTVKTAGLSDFTSWGALWRPAVELSSICARHGMQGRQVRLGQNVNLKVTLITILMLSLGDDGHLAVFLNDPTAYNADS